MPQKPLKTLRFPRISQKSAKKFKSNLKIFPFNPFTSLPSHSHKTASQSHFSLLFPSHFRYYFHIRKSSKIVSFQTKITFIHGVQHKIPIFFIKKNSSPSNNCNVKLYKFGFSLSCMVFRLEVDNLK